MSSITTNFPTTLDERKELKSVTNGFVTNVFAPDNGEYEMEYEWGYEMLDALNYVTKADFDNEMKNLDVPNFIKDELANIQRFSCRNSLDELFANSLFADIFNIISKHSGFSFRLPHTGKIGKIILYTDGSVTVVDVLYFSSTSKFNLHPQEIEQFKNILDNMTEIWANIQNLLAGLCNAEIRKAKLENEKNAIREETTENGKSFLEDIF